MDNIFNIKINKNDVTHWSNDFEEIKTENIRELFINSNVEYHRFISKNTFKGNTKQTNFNYKFVIEYYKKNSNNSYYNLSLVPTKDSLYKDRIKEICEEYDLDEDIINENDFYNYDYVINIGQLLFENQKYNEDIINELSYVSNIIKDILFVYLSENYFIGTIYNEVKKYQILDFLCNNIEFF